MANLKETRYTVSHEKNGNCLQSQTTHNSSGLIYISSKYGARNFCLSRLKCAGSSSGMLLCDVWVLWQRCDNSKNLDQILNSLHEMNEKNRYVHLKKQSFSGIALFIKLYFLNLYLRSRPKKDRLRNTKKNVRKSRLPALSGLRWFFLLQIPVPVSF